jgi:hypothetical protein
MSLTGSTLTLLLGPTVPLPAPPSLVEAVRTLTVEHKDEGRSGFQLVLAVGRSPTSGLVDYDLVMSPLLQPFGRVQLVVTLGAVPQVLFDGVITNTQLQPSNEPGASTLTITGEDVSVMLDLQEKSVEHPAQPEMVIAMAILAQYPQLGLIPEVFPPPAIDVPVPTERTPTQQGTDLAFLTEMAERYGYVFYVAPGPVPGTNRAYWGPRIRPGAPQRALSYNVGPMTNVRSLSFQYDGLATTLVAGQVQDRSSNQSMPVQTFAPTRPPMSARPASVAFAGNVPSTLLRDSGLTVAQALARAQGRTDASSEATVTASGELDAGTYGGVLQARGLVGLRGAGLSFDGLYYVKSVTHELTPGSYAQKFNLTRDGVGSTLPAVLP